ncbi:peptidoglycan DD-metalloendopeptidase family protein [bacterium]|uniref:M23ase beta-sheet core domain-containing protein n=2 Tax=Katanobacteria TaxID=422282 RepID=A0A2M7X1Y7_UNCKA|nr:peptidoglycan DD-metalloendopeptidase family protein [bacterium]PIP56370.1 MAG: hypothetical protein COX05_03375 [candidate division WWE3 bacterium CG22_combo_CG10-13_8_21_14_all_39_12]PJA40184.1 MAG: hypothetical protein CO179_03070 [candidate division WWE3 bacterium CG_4_9_14_3_um_filter_39_7]
MKKYFHILIIVFVSILVMPIRSGVDVAYGSNTNSIGAQTDTKYEELKTQESKKAEYERKINELKSQEQNLQNQMAYLETQESLTLLQQEETRNSIASTLALIENVSLDINGLSEKQGNLTQSISDIEKVLSARVRSSYQLGSTQSSFALTPDVYSTNVIHGKYLQALQLLDVDLFEKMTGTREVYVVQQQELENLKNDQEQLKVQLEDQNHMLDQQKVELQTQQSTKAWLLSVTANEESQYQNLLSQIEEEIRSIKAALSSVGTKIGDVKQGDVIAHLGNTGCSTGAHVHFGFYVNGVASDPSGRLSDGTFIWPVENYVVTNRFNDPTTALWYQQNFGIPGHNGIDMYDASFGRGVEGAPIFATADGVAYQVSDNKACSFTGTVGKGIRVDHSDGTKTIYWHVQ